MQRPADCEQRLFLEVWVELPTNACNEAVAFGHDAVFNLKYLLPEFALLALSLSDLALKTSLFGKVGAIA